jgi:hypothetical protein
VALPGQIMREESPVQIKVENGRLIFHVERGVPSNADYTNGEVVYADDWDLRGMVVNEGRTILWMNNTVWHRQ